MNAAASPRLRTPICTECPGGDSRLEYLDGKSASDWLMASGRTYGCPACGAVFTVEWGAPTVTLVKSGGRDGRGKRYYTGPGRR